MNRRAYLLTLIASLAASATACQWDEDLYKMYVEDGRLNVCPEETVSLPSDTGKHALKFFNSYCVIEDHGFALYDKDGIEVITDKLSCIAEDGCDNCQGEAAKVCKEHFNDYWACKFAAEVVSDLSGMSSFNVPDGPCPLNTPICNLQIDGGNSFSCRGVELNNCIGEGKFVFNNVCVDPGSTETCGATPGHSAGAQCDDGYYCKDRDVCDNNCNDPAFLYEGKCIDPTKVETCGATIDHPAVEPCQEGWECINKVCINNCIGFLDGATCIDPHSNETCGAKEDNPKVFEVCDPEAGWFCNGETCVNNCDEPMFLRDGKCIDPYSNNTCGASEENPDLFQECESGAYCNGKECVDSCSEPMFLYDGKCIDPTSNSTCGATIENSSGEQCGKGQRCEDNACVDGCGTQMFLSSSGVCVSPASIETCGASTGKPDGTDCRTLTGSSFAGWQKAYCDNIGSDASSPVYVCSASECQSGYHLVVAPDLSKKCEQDSPTECGASITNCTIIPNSKNQQCIDGACTFDCAGGYAKVGDSCVPNNCKPGDYICRNGTSKAGYYQVCSDNHTYMSSQMPCTGGASCKSDDKTCGECVNSDVDVCENDSNGKGSFKKCQKGQWVSSSTSNCGNKSCNSGGTACGDCLNYSSECTDNSNNIGTYRVCKNGAWDSVSCSSVSCTVSKTCGVCKNGDKKCEIKNGVATEYVCANGQWPSTGTACGTGYSCDANSTACSKVCKEGELTCATSSSGSLNRTCIHGQWQDGNACPNGVSCDTSAKACGVCTNTTDVKCETGSDNIGKQYICSDGKWPVSGTNCTKNNANVSCKSATECGECKNYSTRCTNSSSNGKMVGTPQTCENGVWKGGSSCVNVSCNGAVCGECANGDSKCQQDTDGTGKIITCASGKWPSTSTSTCTKNNKNVSCKSATECGDCKNYSKQCQNDNSSGKQIGKVQDCENGTWTTGTSCGNVSCKGSVCGECVNNTSTCQNKNGIGYKKTCSSGAWPTNDGTKCTTSDYPNGVSCNSDSTDCGVCKDGDKRCNSSGNAETCQYGAWVITTCSNGCTDGDCNAGADVCYVENQHMCVNTTQYKKCSSGHWSSPKNCRANSACDSSFNYVQNVTLICRCNSGFIDQGGSCVEDTSSTGGLSCTSDASCTSASLPTTWSSASCKESTSGSKFCAPTECAENKHYYWKTASNPTSDCASHACFTYGSNTYYEDCTDNVIGACGSKTATGITSKPYVFDCNGAISTGSVGCIANEGKCNGDCPGGSCWKWSGDVLKCLSTSSGSDDCVSVP